jgi:uncharacterized protein (TIGR03086 family)
VDLLVAHRLALTGFGRVLRHAGPPDWAAPTPCRGWDVHALVNHLVNEQRWAPEVLRGATLAEVGDRFDGDLLGRDPLAAWLDASAAAWRAWTAPGALDRPVQVTAGPLPARVYGWEMTVDVAVHGWDLAVALGRPSPLGDDLAEALLAETGPSMAQWRADGLLAAPVPPAPDAGPVDRLLAWLGREPGTVLRTPHPAGRESGAVAPPGR